jgi:hypothetical protein
MTGVVLATVATILFHPSGRAAEATEYPNLAGTYACEGYQQVCDRGRTFTVTQEGARLDFRNEKGETGTAWFTSNITLLASGPWNMLGVILQQRDNAIQWSNGTQWRKQAS